MSTIKVTNLKHETSSSDNITLDSSGRVLVGTSSTSTTTRALFQGNSSDSTGTGVLFVASGKNNPTTSEDLVLLRFGDSGHARSAEIGVYRDGGTWTSGSSQPTRLTFSTTADGASSPTERMRISSTGRGFINADTDCFSISSVSNAASGNALINGRHSGTAGSQDTGTTCFVVATDGDVTNTNNSYGSLSDAKLKENIVDANSQWNDLRAIQVRNYNFKEETGHQTHTQIGVIAQEVELVSPGLVSESPDRDEEGNDLGTVTKSVNYSVLYMKSVKALQEAMERIEQLETRLTALEGGA